MSVALALIDDYPVLNDWTLKIDYGKVNPILDLYNVCKEKGLIGQLERLKSMALATILEDNKMCLFRTSKWRPDDIECVIRMADPLTGNFNLIMRDENNAAWFKPTTLSDFKGNIPADIIRQIPPSLVKDAEVFEMTRAKDPYIAVCIERDRKEIVRDYSRFSPWATKLQDKIKLHYLGVWQWD